MHCYKIYMYVSNKIYMYVSNKIYMYVLDGVQDLL